MILSGIRDELESVLLAAGISKVYKYVPERPIPACAIVEPASDFINVYGDQFKADFSANWRVQVIVPFASNQKETENLDALLEDLIPAIWENTDATKLQVEKPFILEVNNAAYLSTNINISIDIQGGN